MHGVHQRQIQLSQTVTSACDSNLVERARLRRIKFLRNYQPLALPDGVAGVAGMGGGGVQWLVRWLRS